MTEMDRVWLRIQETAQTLATEGQTLSTHKAKDVVRQIFNAERTERPPSDVLDFLGTELQALILKFGQERELG